MSAETKRAAEKTAEHLQSADAYAEAAQEHASKTKDPSLQQKVSKIRKDIQETVTTIKKNLEDLFETE